MKTPFQLSIAKPCQENWEDFSATPSGGFCGSCQKDVIDFSKMTENQIVDFFKTLPSSNTRICGRFEKQQLEPIYNVESWFRESSEIDEYMYEIALNKVSKVPHMLILPKFLKISRNVAAITLMIVSIENSFGQSQKIKGKIVDSSDGSPIAGVSVSVKGKLYNAVTEADGTYKLKVDKEDILVFKTDGFGKLEINSNQVEPVTKLKPASTEMESFYTSLASFSRYNRDYIKGEVSIEQMNKMEEEYKKQCRYKFTKMKIVGSSTVNQEMTIIPEIVEIQDSTIKYAELSESWYLQNAFHTIDQFRIMGFSENIQFDIKNKYRRNDDGSISIDLKDIPEGRYNLMMMYKNSQTPNRMETSILRIMVKR